MKNERNKKKFTAATFEEAKNKLGNTFPKPDRTVAIEQETIAGISEENKKLRGLGEQLGPDGLEYIGSIACHIYRRNKLDGTFNTEVRTQTCLDAHAVKEEVSFALYTTSTSIAAKYGRQLDFGQRKVIKGK